MDYLNQRRFAVTDKQGTHYLNMDDVVYIHADQSYCYIYYLDNGTLRHMHSSKSMGHHIRLHGLPLFGISRSFSVNLNYVQVVRNDRTVSMRCTIKDLLTVTIELLPELKKLMEGAAPVPELSTPFGPALGN